MAIIIIYWKQGFSRGSLHVLPKIRFQKVSWCGSESIYYTSLEFDLSDLRSPLAAWCCPLGSSFELSKAKNVRDPQSTLLLKKSGGSYDAQRDGKFSLIQKLLKKYMIQ